MKQANILPMTKEAALDEQQLAGIREQYPNATEEQLAHAATLNSDDTPVVQELKEWERSLDGGVLATFNEVFADMAEKDPLAFAQELARDWGYDIEASPVYTDEANDRNRYAFLVSSKLEALARDLLTVIDPESEGEAAQTAFDSWVQQQNVDMLSPINQAILSELVQRYQATTGVTLALQASTKRMQKAATGLHPFRAEPAEDPFDYIDMDPISYVFSLVRDDASSPLTARRLRDALIEDSGVQIGLGYAEHLLASAKSRLASKRGAKQYDLSNKAESLANYLETNVIPVMSKQEAEETLAGLNEGIRRAQEAGLLSEENARRIAMEARETVKAKGKEGLWGHIVNLTLKGKNLGLTPQRRWAADNDSFFRVENPRDEQRELWGDYKNYAIAGDTKGVDRVWRRMSGILPSKDYGELSMFHEDLLYAMQTVGSTSPRIILERMEGVMPLYEAKKAAKKTAAIDKVTCPHCSKEFETLVGDYMDTEDNKNVTCPKCHKSVRVASRKTATQHPMCTVCGGELETQAEKVDGVCDGCWWDSQLDGLGDKEIKVTGGTYWSSDGPPGSGNSMVDGADEELDRRDRSATEERQARRSFEEKLAEDLRIPEEDAYDWAEIFYEDMGEWERNFETIVEWIKEGFTAEQASYWKAEVGSDVSEVKAYMSENEVGRAGQRMASFDEELVARLTRKAYDPADSLKPMTWVVQHNEDAVAEEFMHEEKLEGEDAEEEEESGEGDTIKIEVDPETHKVEVDFGDEEQGEDEEEAEEPKQVAPKSKEEAPNEKDPKNLNKADEADQVNY